MKKKEKEKKKYHNFSMKVRKKREREREREKEVGSNFRWERVSCQESNSNDGKLDSGRIASG